MSDSRVFDELLRVLEKNPAQRWIFGEPVTLGDRRVVPVSAYRLEVELPSAGPTAEGQPAPSAGALRLEGQPLGFLGEQDGRVAFVPIAAEAADAPCEGPPPRWVDDLFRKLDEVRFECGRRPRDVDDEGRRGRSRCDDDEPRERRPRRDRDERD